MPFFPKGCGPYRYSLRPSAYCRAGELVELAVDPIAELLQRGAVPLIYGDVALDRVQGCTIISTEQIFSYLAQSLRPQRIIMAGEVAGVYSGDPQRDSIVRLIPEISAENYPQVEKMLSASFGVDVTGGMVSKVADALSTRSGAAQHGGADHLRPTFRLGGTGVAGPGPGRGNGAPLLNVHPVGWLPRLTRRSRAWRPGLYR